MVPASPSKARSSLVPVWLDRLAGFGWRVLATVALMLVLGAIAVFLGSVTASILVSLIISAALVPIVRRARARGLSRSVSAGIAAGVGLAIAIVSLVLLAGALLPSIVDLISAVSSGIDSLGDALASLGLPDWALAVVESIRQSVRDVVALDLGQLADQAVLVGTVAVLSTFLTYFLLQDGDRGWAWAMALAEPWQAERLTDGATVGFERVGSYVRRTAALALMDAAVVAVLLSLLGVPLVGPLVALVFLAGLVPYLGAIISTLAVGLAVLAQSGPTAALVVVAGLAVAAVAEERLLARLGMGDRGSLHPVLVLVAIPAGATLFGVFGLLAALPVTVFVLAVARSIVGILDMSGDDEGEPIREPGDVPRWLDKLGQWSWRALVVVGVVAVGVQLLVWTPAIVLPGVLALVAAATLLPLVERLGRAGWSRSRSAAGATIGATAAITLAVLVTIAWTLAPLQDIMGTALDGADATDIAWLRDAVGELGAALAVDVAGMLRSLVLLGLGVLVTLLLTFFFLRDGPAWWDAVTRRFRGPRGEHLDEAGDRAVGVLSGYMVGTALISLFGAVTSWLIMALLGLPLALPIAVLTFFGGFIPYIGSFITTALAFLVAVAVGEPIDIVIMGVYTIVFNLIQGSFVAPIVYSRTLSLHPAIVLLAVPVGSAVAGILGMFLVVPIAAIIAATWRLVLATIEADEAAAEAGAGAVAPVEPAASPGTG